MDFQPDVTAPGVNIMAAWSPLASPTGLPFDTRAVQYNIISGTSMSCPHTTGLATLLKAVNPHWSPDAIKSAIMSTGKNTLSGGAAEKHLFLFPIRICCMCGFECFLFCFWDMKRMIIIITLQKKSPQNHNALPLLLVLGFF